MSQHPTMGAAALAAPTTFAELGVSARTEQALRMRGFRTEPARAKPRKLNRRQRPIPGCGVGQRTECR